MLGSAVLLLFIAAGFFTSSMHNFQELDLFGTWSPKAQRPWQNSRVFDATSCCNDKTNKFWVLMRAMLGWQDQPTPMEFFAYAFYWVMILTIGYVMVRRAKRQMAALIKELDEYDRRKAEEATNKPQSSLADDTNEDPISSQDANLPENKL